jgi:hypothetical protein
MRRSARVFCVPDLQILTKNIYSDHHLDTCVLAPGGGHSPLRRVLADEVIGWIYCAVAVASQLRLERQRGERLDHHGHIGVPPLPRT